MKFCTKCGRQLEDNEVCSCSSQNEAGNQTVQGNNAGQESNFNQDSYVSQDTYVSSGNTTPEYINQPEFQTDALNQPVKGSSKKAVLGLVAAVVVVIALGALMVLSLSGGGYKKPLDKICKAINKQETDINKLATMLLPDFAGDAYKDVMAVLKDNDDVEDAFKDVEDSVEDLYDMLEDELGKDVKVSYEIKKKEKMDKDDLEDIEDTIHDMYDDFFEDLVDEIDDMDSDDWEDMADELDISVSKAKKLGKTIKGFGKELEKAKVTSGYTLKVKVKLKGDDDSVSETFEFNMIKVNGDWMIDYFTLFEENPYILYDLM